MPASDDSYSDLNLAALFAHFKLDPSTPFVAVLGTTGVGCPSLAHPISRVLLDPSNVPDPKEVP